MRHLDSWVMGVLAAVFGLIGLFGASRAADPVFYFSGLALFAFGFLFVMGLIHAATEGPERH